MTLVPHDANQYRPHLIRTRGIVAMAALVLGAQLIYTIAIGGSVLGAQQAISSSDLFSQTNTQREVNKLSDLQLSDQLSKAAFLKAQDMFKQQYWAHTAPDGTTPWHWFGTVGYDYTYAGENLAKDFMSASGVMAAWMASPDHRANILNTHYTQVGFAVVDGTLNGQQTTLVVALYGQPISVLAATSSAQKMNGNITSVEPIVGQSVDIWTRLVAAADSFTPVALLMLLFLTIASLTAGIAHLYRNKLPKQLRQSWYRHHSAYKLTGFMMLFFAIVSLYSNGQI